MFWGACPHRTPEMIVIGFAGCTNSCTVADARFPTGWAAAVRSAGSGDCRFAFHAGRLGRRALQSLSLGPTEPLPRAARHLEVRICFL